MEAIGIRCSFNPFLSPSSLFQPRIRSRSYCRSPLLSTAKVTTFRKSPVIVCCSGSIATTVVSPEAERAQEEATAATTVTSGLPPLRMKRERRRHRKQYPGEKEGITEEMRFVAMKLRNVSYKVKANEVRISRTSEVDREGENGTQESLKDKEDDGGSGINGETWQPSMEGFVKYLVDSKLVFNTIERIVDESSDVFYAYFRKTGLERSDGLSKDLEWLSQRGTLIPEPSNPGVTYSKYLEELAEKSPPLFLCHLYNIYFSHIAGGQVITRKVSDMILGGRELEFYKWDGDPEELMKAVREKLNALGEHWRRDEKNKCLKEAKKAFQFLGQIVRLIIL